MACMFEAFELQQVWRNAGGNLLRILDRTNRIILASHK